MKLSEKLDQEAAEWNKTGTKGTNRFAEFTEKARQLEKICASLVLWDEKYPKDRKFNDLDLLTAEFELNTIVAAAKEVTCIT